MAVVAIDIPVGTGQRIIGLPMIKRVLAQPNNTCVSTLMLGVAIVAILSSHQGAATVKAS